MWFATRLESFPGRGFAAALLLTLALSLGAAGEAQAETASASLPKFRAEWLVPYLAHGRAEQARQALLAGAPARAVPLLEAYLKQPRAPSREQAQYLLAHALLQSDQAERAAELFSALVTSYPLLKDYHLFYAAKSYYRLRQFDLAEQRAAQVAADAPVSGDAALVRADALRALGRPAEVLAIWRRYLERSPRGARLGEAHLRLAEALVLQARAAAAAQRAALLEEALEHYKQVIIQDPLGSQRSEAEQRLAELAREVAAGATRAELSAWQRYDQAKRYFEAMRHEQAEPAFTTLLRRPDLSPELRCKASYHLAKTVFRRRDLVRAAPLYTSAVAQCRQAGQSDLLVKSLYEGARSLMRAHKFDEAIAQLALIENDFPAHSYADDARLMAAEAYEAQNKRGEVLKLLESLPARYPRGDMAHEALWRLARSALVEKHYEMAEGYLDRALKELGRPIYYYAFGQALYWKARIADQRGARDEAARLYEQCIRDYPLSYYALMAFNRLREGHRPLFNKLQRELITPVGQAPGRWVFAPRALFAQPGFLRGVELARLGFGAAAAAELARLGLALRRDVPSEDLWLAAVLFDRAELWNLSHQVPRSYDQAYRSGYPLGEAYRQWAIAYPLAFRLLVVAQARQAGIREALVYAIMREESGFTPTIESWANAVGLMQLLVRTAQRAGSAEQLEVTRQKLHDPALNIKLGATYLGFLSRTFGDCTPLAIAGYNAGEGAVQRWIGEFGRASLDEFIERIPFDQTRRYTKRVLSSLLAYAVLYPRRGMGQVPQLAQRIPPVRREELGRRRSSAARRQRK